MLLVLNIPMIGVWVSMLRVPSWLLGAFVLVIATLGTYSVRGNMMDVYVLAAASGFGYFFHKLGFSLSPLILGLILGPEIEKHMRQGLYLSRGHLTYFIERPIAGAIWGVTITVLIIVLVMRFVKKDMSRKMASFEIED